MAEQMKPASPQQAPDPANAYDECPPTPEAHDRALEAIAAVPAPQADPLYGATGALVRLWC